MDESRWSRREKIRTKVGGPDWGEFGQMEQVVNESAKIL